MSPANQRRLQGMCESSPGCPPTAGGSLNNLPKSNDMDNEPQPPRGEIVVLPPATTMDERVSSPPVIPSAEADQPPLGLSKKRLALAFAIAGISDTVSLFDVPF